MYNTMYEERYVSERAIVMKSLIFVHEVLDFCIGLITMQRLKRLGNHIFD